jgi:hypothetical protein
MYLDRDNVIRIPAFVTRIDKSRAYHIRDTTTHVTRAIAGRSEYFPPNQSPPETISSLLMHEALEYGYRI